MVSGNRLARLERLVKGQGLDRCPSCQDRLCGKVPVKTIRLAEGEPVPPADHCPTCGVEWPMMVWKTPLRGPFMVLTPLPYDPIRQSNR